MPSREEIAVQLNLLKIYRQNLSMLLQQRANIGINSTPISLANEIKDCRHEIQRIKNILLSWNVDVDNHPDDDVEIYRHNQREQYNSKRRVILWSMASFFLIILMLFSVKQLFEVGGGTIVDVPSYNSDIRETESLIYSTESENVLTIIKESQTATGTLVNTESTYSAQSPRTPSITPATIKEITTPQSAQTPIIAQSLSDLLLEAQEAWSSKGDSKTAINNLNKILSQDENFYEAHILIGRIHFQSKADYDIGKSLYHFDKAIEINPEGFDGYYNKAMAYGHMSHKNPNFTDKAIETMTKAISIRRDMPGAWKGRAQFYIHKGGHACRAIEDLMKAIEITGNNYNAVYFFLGNAYHQLGDWDNATAHYNTFEAGADKHPGDSESKTIRETLLESARKALGPRPENPSPTTCE